MQIIRRIVAERVQIESFQKAQLLKEDRSLGPRLALEDRVAVIVDLHRLFDLSFEPGQILQREQAAVAVRPIDDIRRDIAAVKALARRAQSGAPAAGAGARFGVEQPAEKIRQRGVLDPLARIRHPPLGQIDLRAGGPVLEEVARIGVQRGQFGGAGDRGARAGRR